MDDTTLLRETFGRIQGIVRRAVDGLDADALAWRPDPDANSIAWLVWHLTRVQDDHVAELADQPQVWESDSLTEQFGLPDGAMDTGYGHTSAQVAAIRPTGPEPLLAYLDEVVAATDAFLRTIGPDDLDRVVDSSWDPPVTMGVRLVSVISDNLQHAGQAAYLRGIYDRTVLQGG